MKQLLENWKGYLNEDGVAEEAPQFRLAKPTLLQLKTEQDGSTRDILIVEHPDQTVKAYFKSSGVSGGGYKGEWIPFEGWSTIDRVPKGQTFTDGVGVKRTYEDGTLALDRAYGHYAIMAKTYWNVGSAKPPSGTIHAAAADWLQTLDDLPEEQKPQIKQINHAGGVEDNIKFLGQLNKQLWKLGAIDRNADVLNATSGGRRIQFGLDKKS